MPKTDKLHPLAVENAELRNQVLRMAKLLLECRDALPAISTTAARLHNLDLTLADRIEEELKPWAVSDDASAPEPEGEDG